jgi:hypothetical protein
MQHSPTSFCAVSANGRVSGGAGADLLLFDNLGRVVHATNEVRRSLLPVAAGRSTFDFVNETIPPQVRRSDG